MAVTTFLLDQHELEEFCNYLAYFKNTQMVSVFQSFLHENKSSPIPLAATFLTNEQVLKGFTSLLLHQGYR